MGDIEIRLKATLQVSIIHILLFLILYIYKTNISLNKQYILVHNYTQDRDYCNTPLAGCWVVLNIDNDST